MTARYGAWRFAFRGFDPQAGRSGLAVSPKGGIDLVRDDEAVRQAILMLVSTRPGERVMRLEYGCYLFRLAFAPNDDTTAGLAIHYVRQALDRWEPRIVVLRLDANRNREDSSRLDIDLQYRPQMRAHAEQLTLAFDLQSGRLR